MAKEKKFFIYKTTNLITGKYYIGMHITTRMSDGYIGSGLILRRSVAKYGRENHVREILEFCDSQEDLVRRESELITESVVADNLCMNIRLGGIGGGKWTAEQQRENNRRSIERQRQLHADSEWSTRKSVRISESLKASYLAGDKVSTAKPHPDGWTHSNETLEKMRSIFKENGHGLGERNSQHGTIWITDGSSSKKVKASDVIPDGWVRGRHKQLRS